MLVAMDRPLLVERLRGPWTLFVAVLLAIAAGSASTPEGFQLPEYQGNVDFRRENPHSLLRTRQSSGTLGQASNYERRLLPAEPLQFAASSPVAHSVDAQSEYDYSYGDYPASRTDDDPREMEEGHNQAGSLSNEDYQSHPDSLSSIVNEEKSPHSFNQDSPETFLSDYTMDSQETGTSSSFEKDQDVGFRTRPPAPSHFTPKLKISKGSVTPTTWRPRFPFSGEETSPFPLRQSKPLFRSHSAVNSREEADISTFRPTTFRHSFQTQNPTSTSLRTHPPFFQKSTIFPVAPHDNLRDNKNQALSIKKDPNTQRSSSSSVNPANARRLPPVRAPFFPRLPPPPPPPPPPSSSFPSLPISSSTEFTRHTSKLEDMVSEEINDEHNEDDEIPEVTEYQKDDENLNDEITELAHVAEHAILDSEHNPEIPKVAEHSGEKETQSEALTEKPVSSSTQSPVVLTTASTVVDSEDNSLEPSGGSTSIDMVTEIVANFPSEQKETIISSVQTSKSAEEGLAPQEEAVAYSEEEGTADYGTDEEEHKTNVQLSTDAPSTSLKTTKIEDTVSVTTMPPTTSRIDKSHSSESTLVVKSVKTSMSFSRSTSNSEKTTEKTPEMISSEEKVHVKTEISADIVPVTNKSTITLKDLPTEIMPSTTESSVLVNNKATSTQETIENFSNVFTQSSSMLPEMTNVQVIVRTESSSGMSEEVSVETSSAATSFSGDSKSEANTNLGFAEITSMEKSSNQPVASTMPSISEPEGDRTASAITTEIARNETLPLNKDPNQLAKLLPFLLTSTTTTGKTDQETSEEKQTRLIFDINTNKTKIVKIMTEDPSILAKMTPPPRNTTSSSGNTQGLSEVQTSIISKNGKNFTLNIPTEDPSVLAKLLPPPREGQRVIYKNGKNITLNIATEDPSVLAKLLPPPREGQRVIFKNGKNITLNIATEDPSILAKLLPPPREGQPRSLNVDGKSNSLQNTENEKASTRPSLPSTTTLEPVLLVSIPGVPKQVGKLPIITRHNVTRKPFLMARATTRNPLPPPTFRKISDILNRNKSATTRRPSYNKHQYEGNYNEDPDRHSTESPHPTTTTTERTTTTLSPYLKWGQSVLVSGRLKLTDGIEWKENFRDPHSEEFKMLANEIEGQLDKLYKNNPGLGNKYKGVEVDHFSKGSVLVDYTLYLRPNILGNVEQQLRDAYRKGLSNGTHLGRYKVDPVYADFKVERFKTAAVAPTNDDGPLFPHWAIAVVVIGAISILFLVILAVVMTRCKQAARRKYGTPLTEHILTERSRTWDKETSNENSRTWDKKQGYDSIRNEGLYGVSDAWNEQKLKPKPASNSNLYGHQGSLSYSKRPSVHTPYHHNDAFEKEEQYGHFASYSNNEYKTTHMPPKYDDSWDDGPEANRYQATHLPPKYDNSWDDELNIYTKGGSRKRDYDTTF